MKAKEFTDYIENYIREYDLREADIRMIPEDGGMYFEFTIKISGTRNDSIIYATPMLIQDAEGNMDFDRFESITHYMDDPENPQYIPILREEAKTLRNISMVAESHESSWANISPRNMGIMEDIDNGMSFTDAAKKYGISPARTRECYLRAKRRSRFTCLPNNATEISFHDYALKNLSTRTYNAITRAGITDYDIFLSKTDEDLSHIRGLGPLSIVQLSIFRDHIKKELANK